MAKKKSSALLAVAYAAILFLFGMLLWLFWRGGTELSSYEQSVNFDTSLTGVMVQYGITSTAIVSQSQREMKQGGRNGSRYRARSRGRKVLTRQALSAISGKRQRRKS